MRYTQSAQLLRHIRRYAVGERFSRKVSESTRCLATSSNMSTRSGILYLTSHGLQPGTSATDNADGVPWSHQSFIKSSLQYRAADGEVPDHMNVHEVTDIDQLRSFTASKFQSGNSGTRIELGKGIPSQLIESKAFDFVSSQQLDDYKDLGGLAEDNVIVAVFITLQDSSIEKKNAHDKWYEEEHIPMLSKVPGWFRTRRFVTSNNEPEKGEIEYLALHEYSPKNGLDGPEFKAATSTPWNAIIKRDCVKAKRRRVWQLERSPVGNDMSNVVKEDPPVRREAEEGTVVTKDGVRLSYRLDGPQDPKAPLLILSNSVLVDYGIWDGFLASFYAQPSNSLFRICRYLTRGRTAECGEDVTINTLASDVVDILDALKVEKAAAIIGVSLGGITALNTALKHPERIERFICCDTSAVSPHGNAETWDKRIATAREEGKVAVNPVSGAAEPMVGEHLAELTARRWFPAEDWRDPWNQSERAARCRSVERMISENSLVGFESCVKALYDYDLSAKMGAGKVSGMFVVGDCDGVLPQVMEKMAKNYGDGSSRLSVIKDAGHLPMVEQPEEFARVIGHFLRPE